MSIETCKICSSSGKQYSGEKAVISLTSWKKRINTVSKSLFSLINYCKDFHIVLVLSVEEFPKKELELPETLMLFVNNKLIELLWVTKNIKSFKKVIFTSEKYKTVPVISADDDCIYTYNYANDLYKIWESNKESVISNSSSFGSGFGILFPPNSLSQLKSYITDDVIKTNHDDLFYKIYLMKKNRNIIFCKKRHECKKTILFHDEFESISSKKTAIDSKNKLLFTNILKCVK